MTNNSTTCMAAAQGGNVHMHKQRHAGTQVHRKASPRCVSNTADQEGRRFLHAARPGALMAGAST